MASFGDIYFVRTHITLSAFQEAIIASFYEVTAGGSGIDAEAVADDYDTNVLAEIELKLSDTYTISRIYTINGMDNSDFNDTNPARVGDTSGSPLPSVAAVGFRSPWNGPGYRRARHNLPLGFGSWLDANGNMSTAARTTLVDLTTALGALLELTGGSIEPVTIAGSFQLGVPPSRRSLARGQWEVNTRFTTVKTRQDYNWIVPS